MNKYEKHKKICEEMNDLYIRKNKDYGDSFGLSFKEEGMAMPRIRLTDKLNRFKKLSKAGKQQVNDESMRDTLIDLANYAIMTIIEMEENPLIVQGLVNCIDEIRKWPVENPRACEVAKCHFNEGFECISTDDLWNPDLEEDCPAFIED